MDDFTVKENSDGSYTISGSDVSTIFENISGIKSDLDSVSGDMSYMKTDEQKFKEMVLEVKDLSHDYLKSKQQIDGFLIFGIFVLVGLLVGRFLYGILKH